MKDDFWTNVFLECDIKDVLNFRLVCKNSKIRIDDEHFWKIMMHRDFTDLHKLNEESWLSYYKRRNIKYGIPVIIDKKEKFVNIENINEMLYKGSYKCTYEVLNNNILKCLYNPVNTQIYILSTEHKVYSFNSSKLEDSRMCQLKEVDNIINIEISSSGYLFFIDGKNNLYRCDAILKIKLLSRNTMNIFRSHRSDIALYYTKECGTYSISDDGDDIIVKVLDIPVLSWLKMGNFKFFATCTYRFSERYFDGEKYEHHNFKLKAKQLSYINPENFAILGTDGFVRIYNHEDRMYKINIPNVEYLSEDTFLTKNGDLYSFDENIGIHKNSQMLLNYVLMDTDIVNIGNFCGSRAFGCYIKRYFFIKSNSNK